MIYFLEDDTSIREFVIYTLNSFRLLGSARAAPALACIARYHAAGRGWPFRAQAPAQRFEHAAHPHHHAHCQEHGV